MEMGAIQTLPEKIITREFETSNEGIRSFQQAMIQLQAPLFREMPWRVDISAYAVWISESMLQQTQVARVIPKFESFIRAFPAPDALAAAATSDVLEAWQGLGYNRRALALKRAAEIISHEYGGVLPKTRDQLIQLPGIGPATSAGIMAFAYDKPATYLETNVRSVFIHHFYRDEDGIKDSDVAKLVEQACPSKRIRQWYWGLLDYGAYLKKNVVNPGRKSATYAKQSKFEGSYRQKRSFLMREVLADECATTKVLMQKLNDFELREARDLLSEQEVQDILEDLARDGFVSHDAKTDTWEIAN